MINIDQYIKDKKWREIDNLRRNEIYDLIKTGHNSNSLLEKLGCVLLYNQFNEDLIKENLILSYTYVTLQLRPKKININLSFDNDTFGVLINKFKQLAIQEYNYKTLIQCLKEMNKKRNLLVHQILKIKNTKKIKEILNEYIFFSEECRKLLIEYLNALLNDIEWVYGEYSKEYLTNPIQNN